LPLKPGLKKVEPVETIIIFEVFDEISVTQYCAKHKLIISNMGQGNYASSHTRLYRCTARRVYGFDEQV
jgi:hypothetical protein